MSKNYDNWEKLVDAVIRKEELKRLAMIMDSTNSSSSNLSSSSNTKSQLEESSNHDELFASETSLSEISIDTLSFPQEADPTATCIVSHISGKSCHMFGARKTEIQWGDTLKYWKWTSHQDSRFSEVAVLQQVSWLDIRARIGIRLLSPNTLYTAFLVFQLAEWSSGIGPADAIITVPDIESDSHVEWKSLVYLKQMENSMGRIAVNRADGWMEVELGKFYTPKADGEVEARLMDTTGHFKKGLIVEGIEFRPTHTDTPFELIKSTGTGNLMQRQAIAPSMKEGTLESSVSSVELLMIRVSRATNLADRDYGSINPYVVLKLGNQKFKTHVISKNQDPEWNETLTFAVQETDLLVLLTVKNRNMFGNDDKNGNAEFEFMTIKEASKMQVAHLPDGTNLKTIKPSQSNCLAEESHVVWKDGKVVQNMCLRLKNVESGELELQIRWLTLPM